MSGSISASIGTVDYSAREVVWRRSLIFALMACCFIVCQCQRACMAVLAPILIREIGVSAEALGNMTGAFFLGVALAQIPAGILFDRFGARTVTGLGLLFGVAGGVLFTLSSDPGLMITGQAILGLGTSPVFTGSLVLIGRWWPTGRFATLTAAMLALGYVGNLLSTAPFQWTVDWVGDWRPVFGAMIAALALSGLLILLLAHEAPKGHDWYRRQPESLASVAAGLREVLRHPAIVGLFGAAAIGYSTNFAVRGLWGGPYLLDVHGLGADQRGWLLMIMSALGILGIFTSGWLAGRLRNSLPVITGFAVAGISILALIAAWPGIPLPWLIGLLLVFSCVSNFMPAVLEHGRSLFDDRLRGRSLTTVNSAVFFGVGVTQFVTGQLIDAFPQVDGSHPEIAYRAMFVYVAAAGLLGLALYLWRGRRGRRPGANVNA